MSGAKQSQILRMDLSKDDILFEETNDERTTIILDAPMTKPVESFDVGTPAPVRSVLTPRITATLNIFAMDETAYRNQVE